MITKYKKDLIKILIDHVHQEGESVEFNCRRGEALIKIRRTVFGFTNGYYLIEIEVVKPFGKVTLPNLFDLRKEAHVHKMEKLLDKYLFKNMVESRIADIDGLKFILNNPNPN